MRFDIFIPENQGRFPFLMLVTRGAHTHHPPYPTKLPHDIADEVKRAIQQHDLLDLTARKPNRYLVHTKRML